MTVLTRHSLPSIYIVTYYLVSKTIEHALARAPAELPVHSSRLITFFK